MDLVASPTSELTKPVGQLSGEPEQEAGLGPSRSITFEDEPESAENKPHLMKHVYVHGGHAREGPCSMPDCLLDRTLPTTVHSAITGAMSPVRIMSRSEFNVIANRPRAHKRYV